MAPGSDERLGAFSTSTDILFSSQRDVLMGAGGWTASAAPRNSQLPIPNLNPTPPQSFVPPQGQTAPHGSDKGYGAYDSLPECCRISAVDNLFIVCRLSQATTVSVPSSASRSTGGPSTTERLHSNPQRKGVQNTSSPESQNSAPGGNASIYRRLRDMSQVHPTSSLNEPLHDAGGLSEPLLKYLAQSPQVDGTIYGRVQERELSRVRAMILASDHDVASDETRLRD
ncbi:hypothetical protein B0H67DRAFT_594084 [Lasiosphaeris hirsuta]|uniref:Uncharacterized protein n=1 Tax=Lasiosphaeris hirsuta TaxID=260670 RepID=A0AA39ZXJ2_9PEZI|nr:hypothetical protein B0H67DRAFT_594084 [Lasiosphaeris hirsuta]